MGAEEIVVILRDLKPIFEHLKQANGLVLTYARAINTALELISAIKSDEVELKLELQESKKQLTIAKLKADNYISSVRKLIKFATLDNDDKEDMESAYKKGNFKVVTDFIIQLKRYGDQSDRYLQEVFKAVEDAQKKCDDGLRDNEAKRQSASTRKRTAQVLGGATAVGAVGAGVGVGITLSVIAGVFTFGIGAVVGLSLTAGTAVAAEHYEAACKSYKELAMKFEGMGDDVKKLHELILGISEPMKSLTDERKNLKHSVDNEVRYRQFCAVFDNFLDEVGRVKDALPTKE